ncbi:MAG: hypothetical protein LBP57_05525 [Endomicrobium sp.]|jgi:phosphoribosylglycinamide formyltransferase 2|nr:hypothetical protein [Endomicrobium sp.]
MVILVLGGGQDQARFIVGLKRRGHRIIVVDYFDNIPANEIADKHVVESTLNINAIVKIAEGDKSEWI